MSAEQVASDLEDSIQQARSWLTKLSSEQVTFRPTPDRWSIAEVIGHLIDSACNNHQRFVRAQTADPLVFPKYDQNSWAELNHYHTRDWSELVELWFQYNRQLAHLIRHIPSDKLTVRCEITGYEPCTLGFLLEDYVVHMNHHLTKIQERVAT
jgi:hypothetical protein